MKYSVGSNKIIIREFPGSSVEFYNLSFSLQHQERTCGKIIISQTCHYVGLRTSASHIRKFDDARAKISGITDLFRQVKNKIFNELPVLFCSTGTGSKYACPFRVF